MGLVPSGAPPPVHNEGHGEVELGHVGEGCREGRALSLHALHKRDKRRGSEGGGEY